MKGFIATALVVTGLMGFAAVSTAHAQVTERMRFTTSFPFTVGKTQFAPGTYSVGPIDGELSVLRVTNGHKTAFFGVIPEGTETATAPEDQLTFVRYGERYYLSQISDAVDDATVAPAQFVADEQKEPHRAVAERITIPFTKIS